MLDLSNKTAKEKAQLKSQELAKVKIGKFTKGDLEIEIVGDIQEIEGGIQYFAKAWKNGKQVGFGKDGTVEIERFRVFNPPILVDDPNGDIVREWTDEITGELKQRKLKFDPTEAIKQDLSHTVGIVGKDDKNIVKGKIGHTVDTFYPDANPESTSMDGRLGDTNANWNTLHDATSVSETVDDSGTVLVVAASIDGSSNYNLQRSAVLFDTSALPDTDTISSATLSLYGTVVNDDTNTANGFVSIVSSNPASNTAIAGGDFDVIGDAIDNPTEMHDAAQRKDLTTMSTGVYTDWTLNATGISNVSQTSISKFGFRIGYDIVDVAPTGGAGTNNRLITSSADQTGTAQDPKLVVDHTASVTDTGFFNMF